jgi:hypothetical protein
MQSCIDDLLWERSAPTLEFRYPASLAGTVKMVTKSRQRKMSRHAQIGVKTA